MHYAARHKWQVVNKQSKNKMQYLWRNLNIKVTLNFVHIFKNFKTIVHIGIVHIVISLFVNQKHAVLHTNFNVKMVDFYFW